MDRLSMNQLKVTEYHQGSFFFLKLALIIVVFLTVDFWLFFVLLWEYEKGKWKFPLTTSKVAW